MIRRRCNRPARQRSVIGARSERTEHHEVQDRYDAENEEYRAQDETSSGQLISVTCSLGLILGDDAEDEPGDGKDDREDETDEAEFLARVVGALGS